MSRTITFQPADDVRPTLLATIDSGVKATDLLNECLRRYGAVVAREMAEDLLRRIQDHFGKAPGSSGEGTR